MMYLTIIAVDKTSSDTMSRTFCTNNVETFKKAVIEFETQLPYRKYELMSDELIEDYSKEIVQVLEELEVTI